VLRRTSPQLQVLAVILDQSDPLAGGRIRVVSFKASLVGTRPGYVVQLVGRRSGSLAAVGACTSAQDMPLRR
jgi:hypothetical protein